MTEENKPPQQTGTSKVASLADAALKKARKKKDSTPPTKDDDGRPVIRLTKGKLHDILDQADVALGSRDKQVFDHFGRMVRVTDPDEQIEDGGVKRQAGAILLRDVTVANLCDRLSRVAGWEKYDSRAQDYVRADVPRGVAESMLARAGEWRSIPRLQGFVEAPTLRGDGTVFDVPGYDARSQLFFVGSIPPGYTKPAETKKAAEESIEKFLELFRDIPTDSTCDRAAIVSAVLTALVRRVLPSAPLIGITAPMPGTGKSLVADAISIIATGRRAAVLGLGQDEAEGDKRLLGALLAGDPVIAIDNVERPLFGDLLCQTLTQPTLRIRPLGSPALVSTPTNTLLIATANNLDVRGDLRRRVVLVRLDAKMERPETRKFDTDLLETVTKRRGEFVSAALTIMRAYLNAGCPDTGATPYGSFEHWSKWCRASVMWLGFPDPLSASEALRDQDPDLVVQRQLFTAWERIFGNEPVTASDVIFNSVSPENSDLHAALDTVCAERVAARRLGSWLRRHRNRVVDKMRLEDSGLDTKSKVMMWRVVSL